MLIVAIMAICIICIVPPGTMFEKGLTFRERTMLKPGIDMVGGVSLIYKIRAPQTESGTISPTASNLAEQVMEALKKRVDPTGVRNLVWRPIGADELEIQMPLSPHSEEAPKIRDAYSASQRLLEATNIRQSDVLAALALPADDRAKKLAELTQGDPNRAKLFKQLADMYDQLAAAREVAANAASSAPQRDAAAKVLDEVGDQFDQAKGHIEDDNLQSKDLEAALETVQGDDVKHPAKLAELKGKYPGFDQRIAAIVDFDTTYANYAPIRSSLDDSADLKRLLKGSGVLEFHILGFDTADPNYQAMIARMKVGGKGPSPQPGDTNYRWVEVDRPEEFDKPGAPPETLEWNDKHYMLELITPDASMTKSQPWALERAYPTSDDLGVRVVGFQFDTPGGHLFSELTTKWQPKGQHYRLAIVLDGKIISAPEINGPIGASGIIQGGQEGFNDTELQYLINTLNAGSLPAQLEDEPISERRVGPTLGQDNLNKGLMACGFGLVVVGVFLISYYYVAGIVAFIAILLNLVIILGVLAALNATFTLPSIAAIVLSVGTAVDANVLIFERLREEQHRGLGLRLALSNSYARAFSAIIDSNMTSIITSVFLYMFGSEEVKGFGLTLIIGIVASLFTALFVTKTIFGILIDKVGIRHLGSFPLTFPKWDKFLKPNIDWMGLAWVFYTFSIIGIGSGLLLFGYYIHKGEMLDIEFASGTSVEFDLKQPTPIEDLRKLVTDANRAELASASVISLGSSQSSYQIVTPSADAKKVRTDVVEILGTRLKAQLPSSFTGMNDATPAEARTDKVLFPIPNDLRDWPEGKAPQQAANFTGGVAIRLTGISPPLMPSEIRARVDRERPQTPGADHISSFTVVGDSGDDSPTASATVLMTNPGMAYSADHEGDWLQDLATPAWSLVKDAVNHEADLSAVNSFNPSVAGDARRDAAIALTLSILVIMAYIWVRFGNLKYGTATVIALLHDTIFTLAAMGFAHLLADSAIGNLLQIEPFRINLTVVAGILTIMGYSMIDTIVVFDRIRENRGKYGHLSRMVINDAINQTLSRTILTCGTTTMTVAFMYFMGGSGIHGFTFVLLIGILVGTYSSVAIAAPILLVNSEAERRASSGIVPPPGQQLLGAVK